jgi:hypothetical protein
MRLCLRSRWVPDKQKARRHLFASAGFFDLFALAVSTSRKSPQTRSSRDDDEHDDGGCGSAYLD